MIFSDPRTDIAFKKLFGNTTHKNITISFLNNLLEREEGHKIIDLVINDPSNVPEILGAKASIVDVRCTDQAGAQYIVEMQVTNQRDYGTRALYYSSLAFARQLVKGEKYEKLMPVIFVGILDFALFKNNNNYASHHAILDTKTFTCELHKLEFYFIELAKFHKTLEESETILDKWIYLLKNAGRMHTIPASLQDQALHDAYDVLEQGSWSRAELDAYDRLLDAERSYKSQFDTAIEIGQEKGVEIGRKEGREEGRKEEKIELAQQLLDVLDVQTIAKKTGLSIIDIENLKNKKN